ncbi:MAG TPA: response regulator [Kofleriaceae bacterium]|jgi:DNA-binding response OmpR family regulator
MAKRGARILVVDDDPEILAMVSTRLVARGYEVTTADDGHAALEHARRDHPDVMLLDVMLPGKSGWEVAKEIKHDERLAGIKIVMVSAIGAANELTSPIYGADAHIDKPFEFAKLEQIIQSLVRGE